MNVEFRWARLHYQSIYMNILNQNEAIIPPQVIVEQDITTNNACAVQQPTTNNSPTLTFLAADKPMTKKYFIDEKGEVAKQDYQQAFMYTSNPIICNSIDGLAEIIQKNAHHKEVALIRGCDPAGKRKHSQRTNVAFPEHPEGTPWVMLDIDGINVPEGMSVISQEAIEWLIQEKLPEPFKLARCFYQFSSSAGICKTDGSLLKSGLRVHLFFFFDRRIPGKRLEKYLSLFCYQTGFYEKTFNNRGNPAIALGIDMSPIRTPSHVHYFALPILAPGVVSLLAPKQRFGWVNPNGLDVVTLPAIENAIDDDLRTLKSKIENDWKVANGCEKSYQMTLTKNGIAYTSYYRPINPGTLRTGREMAGHKLSEKGDRAILYFKDENTPGSWYVMKAIPQLAYRFGDGERMPLKELSESAHNFVRDELAWFSEIPQQNLNLTQDGFVPAFDFAQAKHSMIISPTGSGKTTKVIELIRSQMNRHVVIYVAQTIPLVDQMREDLKLKDILATHYRDIYAGYEISRGVVVTTNESLHKVMKALTLNVTYIVIIDEIHLALDDFLFTSSKQKQFEQVISGAAKVLYMSGTVTPLQRTMLATTIRKLHGGRLDQATFCCYDFDSVRTYPLYLVDSRLFHVDLVQLLAKYQELKSNGEQIPRTVLIMDTSNMEYLRQLVGCFNLEEDTLIVSRPESFEEEVEVARCSDSRILISSPLFSIGLNFKVEPEVYWCKIAQLKEIDTSQIIQTINRGNRGSVQCETRLYHGAIDTSPIKFPHDETLKQRLSEILLSECDLQIDGFDMPQLIDRVAYQKKREIEKDTPKSMGELVRDGSFQNHVCSELTRDYELTNDLIDGAKEIVKQAKASARNHYENLPAEFLPNYSHHESLEIMHDYVKLGMEKKYNYRAKKQRLGRDLEAEKIAINIVHTGCKYYDAKKIDETALRVLWGVMPPWISQRYRSETCSFSNQVYVQKLEPIIHFVSQMSKWKNGEINVRELSIKLTQDKKFGDAYLALATNETVFVRRGSKLKAIREEAERLRAKGGESQRKKLDNSRLAILTDWMESIGIFFEKEKLDRRIQRNYDKPIFPGKWDFDQIEMNLRRYSETMKYLPSVFEFATSSKAEPEKEDRPEAEEEPEKFGVFNRCKGCAYYYQAKCHLGHGIDMSELGLWGSDYKASLDCNSYRKAKLNRGFAFAVPTKSEKFVGEEKS